MDPLLSKRQFWQSVGQFAVVVVTGLLVYKDVNAVREVGVLNALWQPALQGLLAALGILGVSRIGTNGGGK